MNTILRRDLNMLCLGYSASVSADGKWVHLDDVLLPSGYNVPTTPFLLKVPGDYPVSPPGVGDSHTFVRPDLRFYGRELRDVHPDFDPGWGWWAWLCFELIVWDPRRDNLVTFMETVRAHLANPNLK
jgi:hypothetical protein